MFEKLAVNGFLDYEKHHGVELTRRGESIGQELAWRRRTVRTFFVTALDTELDFEASYRIGYVLPERGVKRLYELADPSTDQCGLRTES